MQLSVIAAARDSPPWISSSTATPRTSSSTAASGAMTTLSTGYSMVDTA